MDVNFDDLMYRKDELMAAINDMIAKQTNPDNSLSACKYIVTDIDLKDEVTKFDSLTSEQLTNYKPTRENKINPKYCSDAAFDSLMNIKNYKEVLEAYKS